MGMTASQARLLSITARLSDNEHLGQSVSYSKQRLADQTDYIQADYNAALAATKLTVLTGFVGSEPQYTDISYGLMTGLEMAQNTRQYVITDTKGRILVNRGLADAFVQANGNYNRFLEKLGKADPKGVGYTQADFPPGVNKNSGTPEQQQAALQKIHDAWDKYMVSVGLGYGDDKDHDFYIGWTPFGGTGTEAGTSFGGFPTWQAKQTYSFERLYQDNQTGTLVAASADQILQDKVQAYLAACGEDGGLPTPADIDARIASITDAEQKKAFQDALQYSVVYKDPTGNVTTSKDNSWDTNRTEDIANEALYARVPITDIAIEDLPGIVGSIVYEQNELGGWYQKKDADGNVVTYTENDHGAIPTPINYDGTTEAQRELYDYAVALTAAYHSQPMIDAIESGSIQTAANPENIATMKYYQNIFNEMAANGFYTYADARPDTANPTLPNGDANPFYNTRITDDIYLPFPMADGAAIPNTPGGSTPRNTSPLADNNTFEKYIREGAIQIKYYSATEGKFISTTISEDQGVQEVKDERKIAMAETTYQQRMRDLERKDKMLDMELKKIDTEHNALQTEYDSIKGIISKNIEKTFSMFS